jgi:hypothetical protein
LLDRDQLVTPGGELVQHSALGTPAVHRRVLECDDAASALQRQGRLDQIGDDFEEDRANRNGDRHGEAANQRQPAVFEEHSNAETRIERNGVEPLPPARVAPLLLVFLDAAKPDMGLPARFQRVEPLLAHEPLGFHFNVEVHFVPHFGLELMRAPQHAPRRPRLQPQAFHFGPKESLIACALLNRLGEVKYGHSPSLSRRGCGAITSRRRRFDK